MLHGVTFYYFYNSNFIDNSSSRSSRSSLGYPIYKLRIYKKISLKKRNSIHFTFVYDHKAYINIMLQVLCLKGMVMGKKFYYYIKKGMIHRYTSMKMPQDTKNQ